MTVDATNRPIFDDEDQENGGSSFPSVAAASFDTSATSAAKSNGASNIL
jgi:hypothetical protein